MKPDTSHERNINEIMIFTHYGSSEWVPGIIKNTVFPYIYSFIFLLLIGFAVAVTVCCGGGNNVYLRIMKFTCS